MQQPSSKRRLGRIVRQVFGSIFPMSSPVARPAKCRRKVTLALESLESRLVPDGMPVATDFSLSLHMGATESGMMLGGGVLGDNGQYVYGSIVSQPSHGSIAYYTDWSFSYTANTPYCGPDSFQFKLVTPDGSYASDPATCSISVTDTAPTTSGQSINVPSGGTSDAIGLMTGASDPDNDPMTASIITGPQHGSLSSSGGPYYYTPGDHYAGSDSFTYSVTDGALSTSATATINVVPAVTLTNPGAQMNLNHDSVSLGVTATDTGPGVTYMANGLPAGLSINASTGAITGTISNTADTNSPYSVTVTATDTAVSSVSDSKTFSWEVDPQLVVLAQASQENVVGDTVSVGLYYWNTDSTALSFTATGLPDGLNIDSSSGTISGTINATAAADSPYSVAVTGLDDADGVSGTASFDWTVAEPSVTVVGPGDGSSVDGAVIAFQIGAETTGHGTLSYSAAGLPSGLSINSSTGAIAGTIGNDADASSPYSVTLTATDSVAGVSGTASFTWTISSLVLNPPASQQSLLGASVSVAAPAAYSGAGTLTYSSSGLPSGLSIDSATGVISGTIAQGDEVNSPYAVTVTATDGTASASASFSWQVAALFLSNPGDQDYADGATVSITPTVTAPSGHVVTFSALGLPPGASINADTGAISGTLADDADTNGPSSITITASDTSAGTSTSQTFSMNPYSVSSAPSFPSPTAPQFPFPPNPQDEIEVVKKAIASVQNDLVGIKLQINQMLGIAGGLAIDIGQDIADYAANPGNRAAALGNLGVHVPRFVIALNLLVDRTALKAEGDALLESLQFQLSLLENPDAPWC